MKFSLKSPVHIQGEGKKPSILAVVVRAALFVAVWSVLSRLHSFGWGVAIHATLIILVACFASTAAHFAFYYFGTLKSNNFSFGQFLQKFRTGETVVTGLILALATQSTTHLYIVAIVTIFAEVIGKLLFGGYGQNVFNPVAIGLVFNALAFGGSALVVGSLPDVVSTATPLVWLNTQDWVFSPAHANDFFVSSGGIIGTFLGFTPNVVAPGAIAESSRLALVLALVYMCYKKAADWVVPVTYVGVVFIIAFVYGIFIGNAILYPIIHVLVGGVVFGAVFLSTDYITTPITRQGKVIFAIILAFFTMLIRFNTSHVEGVAFAFILTNMMVPFIDSKTLGVASQNIGKKRSSIAITFACAIFFVVGFTLLVN